MHMDLHMYTYTHTSADVFALPWPVRVLEVGECEVELVLASCIDKDDLKSATKQSAILHWYCRGEHCKLDIRVAIRRELKKVNMSYPFLFFLIVLTN